MLRRDRAAFASGFGVPSVAQRGNRRMQTSFCEDDRAYPSVLGEWSGRRGVAIWAQKPDGE